IAANLAVLNVGLAAHRCVQDHRDLFPAVWARKEVLHQMKFSSTNRSKRRTALLHMCCLVLLLLVLEAIRRPGDSFQAGGFNLASTCYALAKGAVFDTVQGVLN